jgi:energy-coupling factor transporter ATP-binding protein EcfA2
MRINELNVGEITEIMLRPVNDTSFSLEISPESDLLLQRSTFLDELVLSMGDDHWSVCADGTSQQALLENVFAQNRPQLCSIIKCIPDKGETEKVIISIRSFSSLHILPEDEEIKINLTDVNFEDIAKHFIKKVNLTNQNILDWLGDHLVVQNNRKTLIAVSAGIATGFQSINAASFRVFGNRISIYVERRDDAYWVSKIVNFRSYRQGQPVFLLQGKVSFVDASVATHHQKTGITELDYIVKQSAGSYLNIWNQYNKLEKSILIERAKDFGWLYYENRTPLPDGGWRLHFKPDQRKKLEKLTLYEEVDFEIAKNLPEEFIGIDENEADEEAIAVEQFVGISPTPRLQATAVNCVACYIDRSIVDVSPVFQDESESPPQSGYLFISMSGDRVRLNRRQYAWNRISSSENPIPGLGLLLERSDKFVSRFFPKEKIDQKELRRAFGTKPTDKQETAINIAINTPDIAIIQGPPGTGKTRVISALNKLIANTKSNRDTFYGQILLTSFQHDAVENVASRSQVLGLPALKVGRRKFQTESVDQVSAWSNRMIHDLQTDITRQNVQPAIAVARKVHTLFLGYLHAPGTTDQTVQMLRDIYVDTFELLPSDLHESIDALSNELGFVSMYKRQEQKGEKELILKAVRGLRTEEVSFRDDGPQRALVLLHRLEGTAIVNHLDIGNLQQAAEWVEGDNLDFLTELAEIQKRIIENLSISPTLEHARLPNIDVENLLARVDKYLMDYISKTLNNSESIVEQFIFDLENDVLAVKETLWHYSAVIAATCQQSVGRFMQLSKSDGLEFDTIIVDEASRSNPLDMLIPMSLAKRRIILVGDHRQLPHILEQDVERRLEHSTKETRDELGKSLFERLFNYLKEREAVDGIRRTVTLDMQYRMHPVLGKFVSQTFYEPHGEGFESDGTQTEYFEQHLEGYQGKVAAWINVPGTYGYESGVQSKSRRKEAEWIAKEVKKILQQDEKISVGIITFYSSQVNAVLREMQKSDLAEEVEGVLQVDRKWSERNGQERLRVGTVDAFQGKEFDVVFLSVVRSNKEDPSQDDEIKQRRKYGFLTLENRLCVAMSRQKRLLVVVGDEAMIDHPSAMKAVPGLVSFHQLCKGTHGIIQRI